jgi:hypothetical protein
VDLVVRESATTTRNASLFKKSYGAGAVSLGANPAGGSMYTVVVK